MLTVLMAVLSAAVPVDTARFQQRIDYRIEATLDEATDVLTARARLHYTNRSAALIDTLYFHLHLNAFRPNSAWAQRELQFGVRRFQDLDADEHAFERVRSIQVNGRQADAVFPGAPDSTVMAVALPASLLPDSSVDVLLDWDARLSTLPRRQGRAGRQYDFAQWYPRIAVHDRDGWQVQPLLPQGEFFGEFGAYDVTLELAADQVVGATGVVVAGDPGWRSAARPGTNEPRADPAVADTFAADPLGLLHEGGAGRKRVRWRAEDVHHFAWSTSPEFVYEGGTWRDIAVHVLYQRGAAAWPDSALARTYAALEFFDTIFGRYPYPQVTNVHRIEPGGTEFPMLMMNGSASQGLIVHEVGHIYAHGILANNEWRDGWLDEGLVSFLTNWFWEERGADPRAVWSGDIERARLRERSGQTQPIALPGADFVDFATYQAMTYTKAALVFRALRWYMGEAAFRAALRHYYEQNAFRHVHEADLRAAMEWAAGEDLGWFFDQWLHTTGTLDYRLSEVQAQERPDGKWDVALEIVRAGEIWMPVDVEVNGVRQRLSSRERRYVVTITTATRPRAIVLDPDDMILDVDPTNNGRRI